MAVNYNNEEGRPEKYALLENNGYLKLINMRMLKCFLCILLSTEKKNNVPQAFLYLLK